MTTCPRKDFRKALLLAASAALVATTLTATALPAAAAAGAGAGAGADTSTGTGTGTDATAPQLTWRPCAVPDGPAGQECADLPVPLDYARPQGPSLRVAVTRLRSDRPAARRGTLVVLPGGPGGSGVQRLTKKGAALRRELGGAYDLVAFDPRGVGGSTTASCDLTPEDRYLTNLRSWPDADGGIDADLARARRIAEACDRAGGAVLRSFTTANQVRDMDRLRQALGERKLSAWGTSYGSYVTAVYAQKFPHRTDRLVLDSTGDPDPERVARGWLANMAQGADDRFPDFAAWAAHPDRDGDGLRLAARPEEVRPLVLALAATLDRAPKESTTPGTPLTGNGLRQVLQNALYGDAFFPALARLVQAAQDPARPVVLPPELAQPMRNEDAALTVAVICNDVDWGERSAAGYRRAVAADRSAHPLTAGMPVNVTPCAFWKDEPAERPTRITSAGPSDILMVQSRRDPATPYAGALKMRAALGDRARLVSVGQGGHGMYLTNGNACGDRAVTAFLTTGTRPDLDTDCPG
ncbi:alpha/beta hydrolase [Streptomyces sp. WAC06614]|uniref:alpha/beta hydrolase n=1 Tax=Streptomyces sp. WAC06614 TaxID=2487416 RepID=UPI000F78D2C5|nr:alpha/beta hydrolase [Streptomyces sp. WAC06614]RSS60951.1 alpha/beta hydrolase [Streptomyces sp. WAC06614]